MTQPHAVADQALDQLFRHARTQNKWLDKPVSPTLLQAVYDLARMGPTSANCSPARFVFLTSEDAKEKLRPLLLPGNVQKVVTAPVTVIIGHDLKFYEHLPKLFPHTDARSWFLGNEALIQSTAFRNGTLQGAYLMMAARSLGLDCGPMSGFDNAGVDKVFFPDGHVKSNFICALGYGDPSGLFPRSPRFSFEEACQVL
ncbi:MAG TPA: malonic semialdehyde reductase [Alphaproteobacteria bacterium]|nr:malonic semialdehyde reductase [Alphaproteobacteria bacterium]HAJ48603.1 malonic semialdehyde reductase [Alphaproteobacteria bacterium]